MKWQTASLFSANSMLSFPSQIIIISFYWNGSYWLSTVMGIHAISLEWEDSVLKNHYHYSSIKSCQAQNYQLAHFFQVHSLLSLHSPIFKLPVLNLGCVNHQEQFAICFFHEIWKKPLQEKRGIRIEVLFRVCSYLVSTELRWGAELGSEDFSLGDSACPGKLVFGDK